MRRATRLFTLAEAERALPLVARIVDDLRAAYAAWERAVARYELAAASLQAEHGEPPEVAALREEVARLAAVVDEHLDELGTLGCRTDPSGRGDVLFHALRLDRLVYLAWTPGSPRIDHWREVGRDAHDIFPLDGAFATTLPG